MDQVTRPGTVWLEILGRHRDVISRTRLLTDAITLGRAYDNDIVLDDPHVGAHHLRIARGGDGAWVAEDLGSLNGTFVEGERTRRERIVLGDATTALVGHTGLRLRRPSDSVPAELPLVRSTPRWPFALVCIALLFALEWLGLWLGETGEPKLIRYLTPLATIAIAIAVWATLWSVVSRVFSGQARSGLHLLIVAAGLLAFSLYDQFSELGAFALSWTRLSSTAYVAAWLIFAAVCFAHLRALGDTKLPLKAAVVIALAALGITMQSLKLSDWRANSGQASTLQKLEPPSIRVVSAQAESAFFASTEALKAGLDTARNVEPVGDGNEAGGNDD
ncbi:MAG: FHA domain-containing protein [Dokdonella sp.]